MNFILVIAAVKDNALSNKIYFGIDLDFCEFMIAQMAILPVFSTKMYDIIFIKTRTLYSIEYHCKVSIQKVEWSVA